MIIIPSLVGLFSAAVVAWAHPFAGVEPTATALGRRTTITTSGNGTAGGFFYYLFEEYTDAVVMDVGIGNYSLQWTAAAQDFIAGIGRNPGTTDPITYSGTFNPGGNAYLSVYGYMKDPLIEYSICETFGTFNPSSGFTHMGNVTSDGSTYDIYKTVRLPPPLGGLQAYYQYISVRQSQRVGGTVTLANHFNAWKALGMNLGTFTYQIVATQGYLSNGSSQINVHL